MALFNSSLQLSFLNVNEPSFICTEPPQTTQNCTSAHNNVSSKSTPQTLRLTEDTLTLKEKSVIEAMGLMCRQKPTTPHSTPKPTTGTKTPISVPNQDQSQRLSLPFFNHNQMMMTTNGSVMYVPLSIPQYQQSSFTQQQQRQQQQPQFDFGKTTTTTTPVTTPWILDLPPPVVHPPSIPPLTPQINNVIITHAPSHHNHSHNHNHNHNQQWINQSSLQQPPLTDLFNSNVFRHSSSTLLPSLPYPPPPTTTTASATVPTTTSPLSPLKQEHSQQTIMLPLPTIYPLKSSYEPSFDKIKIKNHGDFITRVEVGNGTTIPEINTTKPICSGNNNSTVSHSCNICFRRFKRKYNLFKHQQKVHEHPVQFICQYCCKQFLRKSSLVRHERFHIGYKPHVCSDCGRGFTTKFHLRRHSRSHTGERPFACELCGRRFIRKDHIKRHMMTHKNNLHRRVQQQKQEKNPLFIGK